MGQRLQYIVHLHCSCLTPLSALCYFYYRKTLLGPWLPPLPIPNFLFFFLRACLWRGLLLLFSFYLESKASGKQALSPPLHITFNHPHVYSALRPFHCPPTSLSPSLCPAQLPLHAYCGSAFNHSITCQRPFSFYLSLSNCCLPHHVASV